MKYMSEHDSFCCLIMQVVDMSPKEAQPVRKYTTSPFVVPPDHALTPSQLVLVLAWNGFGLSTVSKYL